MLEKCSIQQLGSKPTTIRTTNNTTFTAEVASRKQSIYMQRIPDINCIIIEISINKSFNTIKGLVCVFGYNLSNFEESKGGRIKQYVLLDVIEASCNKQRANSKAKPLLLSFPTDLQECSFRSRVVSVLCFCYCGRCSSPLSCSLPCSQLSIKR